MEQTWRGGVTQVSRNKIVNRLMDTLQKHMQLVGQDGMTELWNIANRFEEKIFYAASDQHDYLRKISLKMLNLETRTQNALNGALPTSSIGTNQRPLDSGITQVQSLHQVVQAEMWNNGIQGSAGGEPMSSLSSINNVLQPAPVMNALGQVSGNFPALNDGSLSYNTSGGQPPSQNLQSQVAFLAIQQRNAQLQQARQQQQQQQQQLQFLLQQLQQQSQAHVVSGDSLQQVGQPGGIDQDDIVWSKMQTLKDKYLQDMKDLFDMLTSRSQLPMPEEQLQKLTHYKNVLQRMMPYLVASKGSLPKEFNQDKVEAFEKQIVSFMETFKWQKQVAPQPQQPQQGNLGQVQAVQQLQQASQILQPDNKPVEQQTPQMNSPLTAPTELQPNNVSSTCFPFLQSNVSSHQQAMGVATQPIQLNNLANDSANTSHQGNIAAFGQNNVNPLQVNVQGMQQLQQDLQFHQNSLLKDQEQSKQLQVRCLQQQRQQQLQKQQQAQLLQAQQAQLLHNQQAQPTPLSNLANALRMNVPGMQQYHQFHQNRLLNDHDKIKGLQLGLLQQYQQRHLQLFYVFFCMLIFTFYLLFVFCGSTTN